VTGGRSSSRVVGQGLFAEDVGMSGVLREFAQHLQVERPHAALSSTVDDVVERSIRESLT